MSELSGVERQRRRRADAERSVTAILDAAVQVLNARPSASIEDVADVAGVTRQTVYAHYPSREALISAAIDRVTDLTIAAIDTAHLEDSRPAEALLHVAHAGWRTYEQYSRLLHMSVQDLHADQVRHEPLRQRLEQLIKRGQDTGDFDRQLSPTWLTSVVIALGHAAAEEVAAERMAAEQATTAVELSMLRIVGATS